MQWAAPAPPGAGPFPALEHQERSTLTHDEAVTVDVERAGRQRGVVVAVAQGAHAGEGGDGDGRDACLGAAAEDDIGRAFPDEAGGLTDGVGAAGAGGGDAEVRTGPAQLQPDEGGGGVGHHHRHQHRADAGRATGEKVVLLLLLGDEAPHAGGGDHPAAGRVGAQVAGVGQGVGGGAEGQLGHPVGAADLLGVEVGGGVELGDLAAEAHGQGGGVDARDGGGA
jgi:hypothetical protein